MTYRPIDVPRRSKLEAHMLSWSGASLSVGDYFDITAISGTFSLSVSNSVELNLPSGHYFVQAFIDISRPINSQNNCQYELEVDGSSIGMRGNSDNYQNNSTDSADAEFTLSSSGVLKIKVTSIENSFPTVTSNSRLIVWRTDREGELKL